MHFRFRSLVLCTGVMALLFAAGCGGSGEEPASPPASPASIGGPENGKTPPQADAGPTALEFPIPEPSWPSVMIETSLGNITVQLDDEKAPQTVDNFLAYVESQGYDQTIFHQVFKDQGIVGGAFSPDLVEKESFAPIYCEADNGLKNLSGTIAMARQPDLKRSATRHFFINVTDNPELDHRGQTAQEFGYCVFGKVTQGMEVVAKIAAGDVHDTEQFDRIPVATVLIKTIRRL